jgi:ribosomal-protein-alanine N-acetyltransferase
MEELFRVKSLETERLVLRTMTLNDIDFIYDLFSKPETNRYSVYEDIKSREEAIDLYDKFMKPGSPTHFRLGVELKETQELVGTLGFYAYNKEHKRAEMGFDLLKSHWGKGIMTEAVRALIRYGFEEMELNRIEATVDPENIRSIRLLERMGFMKEGRLRKRHFYKVRYHDELVFGILKEDWINP